MCCSVTLVTGAGDVGAKAPGKPRQGCVLFYALSCCTQLVLQNEVGVYRVTHSPISVLKLSCGAVFSYVSGSVTINWMSELTRQG